MHNMLSAIKFCDENAVFQPETQIDVLYNYAQWYGSDFMISDDANALSGKNIAVIGAGASGIMTAYLLTKVGAKVTVFEASDRVGGRICSVQFNEGTNNHNVFELGCMRFPHASKTLFSLFDHYKIDMEQTFPDPGAYGVYTQLYYKNKLIQWPGASAEESTSLPQDDTFIRIGKQFNAMMVYLFGDPNDPAPETLYAFWMAYQVVPTIENKSPIEHGWQTIISKYENMSFWDGIYSLSQTPLAVAVADHPEYTTWTQSDMDAFAALGVGAGGFGSLFEIGFVEFLRIIVNGLETNQVLVPDGINTLMDAMKAEIIASGRGDFQLSKKCAINGSNSTPSDTGNVQFTPNQKPGEAGRYQFYADGAIGQPEDNTYDALIVATTTPAMQMMGVTSALGHEDPAFTALDTNVTTAIRSLYMANSSKFFVRTSKKFWQNKDSKGNPFPSNIQTDELFRGLYCLDYNPTNPDSEGVILMSYVWEADSVKLQGLNRGERYKAFLAIIHKINSEFAEQLREHTIDYGDMETYEDYDLSTTNMVDWQTQPHYHGGFKLNYPGQDQMCHDAIFQFKKTATRPTDCPIAICGDSISWIGGWVEGALTSGVNAACGIASALGATLKANSPMDDENLSGISEKMYNYTVKPKA